MPGHVACSPGPPPYAGTASPAAALRWTSSFPRTSTGSTRGSSGYTAPRGLPRGFCVAGEIRYALPPRAVADAARWLTDIGEVRAVVAGAVQRGLCPIERLVEELQEGPKQGSALLRRALAEVADGVRSAAEGQLHALIKRARLPMPMFNPRLFVGRDFLAVPDCWWPDAEVAAEVDSREWHLSPRDWENTLARQARMAAADIIVLHFPPSRIYAERKEVIAEIRGALATGQGRPLPQVRTLRAR